MLGNWIAFHIVIGLFLLLDLGVFRRGSRAITLKESVLWSCFWIVAALFFNFYIYYLRGAEAALQFFTGYLIEKSLSLDNLFVFALIFSAFKVPPAEQHTILYRGIIGALVARIAIILFGTALIIHFHWMTYLLGIFLVWMGVKFFVQKEKPFRPEGNALVKGIKRLFPRFREGSWYILLLIECSDVIFALDSIPAVFAVTTDPFIVYTSNIFAILGLRSLYFVLAAVLPRFRYLTSGLAAVRIFVGLKMAMAPLYVIPIALSLGVVFMILLVSILLSQKK